jgi:hypothetical protein
MLAALAGCAALHVRLNITRFCVRKSKHAIPSRVAVFPLGLSKFGRLAFGLWAGWWVDGWGRTPHQNKSKRQGKVNMESIATLSRMFQAIETLPISFLDDFQREMEEKVRDLLDDVQDFIRSSFVHSTVLVEDFSKNQFQDLLKCMVLFNGESSNGNDAPLSFSDEYHLTIRNYFVRAADRFGDSILHDLFLNCVSTDEHMRLNTLKRLRDVKLLHKEDIGQLDLLHYGSTYQSHSIFDYLVEWDPTALEDFSCDGSTLLEQ